MVALIDPYAQGISSSSLAEEQPQQKVMVCFILLSIFINPMDMNSLINQNLEQQATPWVATQLYEGLIILEKAKSDGRESILNSVYVSGYVLTLQDNVLKPIKSNMGVSYALYDEGAFRNELQGGKQQICALRLNHCEQSMLCLIKV